MFCHNCGTTIDDSQQFCPKCGTAVESNQSTQEQPAAQPANNGYAPQAVAADKGAGFNPKMLVPIILGAVAVIAILVVVLVVKHINDTKINLNDYVKGLDFDGYDTVGTATVDFDTKKLYKDCDEISKKVKKVKDKDYDTWASKELGIKYKLSEDSELSNGDTVTLTWDVDVEDIKKEFGIRVSCKDMEFEVKHLDEVDVIDVFKYVEISYSGTDPRGYASASLSKEAEGDWTSAVWFSVEGKDKDNGYLSNGDTIVVSLSQDNDYYADYYGFVAKESSKEFTVEGLQAYITSFDDIPEDVIEEIHEEVKYDFDYDYVDNWNKGEALTGFTYLGHYFMTPDGSDDYYSYNNLLYMVYQVDVSLPADVPSYTYYYVVRYTNFMFDNEGECTLDADNYYKVYGYIDTDIRVPNSYGEYYFYGQESLDDFYDEYVEKYEHDYDLVTETDMD